MNRDQKAAAIAEIAEQIRESEAVFAVDYRGISVPQAAALRTRLRDADATFRIVKNTLTERAADQAEAAALKELLEGPTALTFVRGDVAVGRQGASPTSSGRRTCWPSRAACSTATPSTRRRSRRSPACPPATCSTGSSWASWPRRSPAWPAA